MVLWMLASCGAPSAPVERPEEWPELGGSFRAQRFSPLTQIDTENARTLGFAWEYEARSRRGRVEHGQEATPIVVDGVLYASGPWGSVFAVDAKTGAERWRYDPEVDGSYNRRACCDVVNRGVQVWNGRVYVGTLDGFLVALDAKSGKELWRVDTLVDRDTRFYTITGPPQVAKDVVVIGNSGAEFGVRGYVTAYDLESGDEVWRFFTVPGDPALGPPESPALERALETWDPNSDWKSGLGGTVWGELNYDPELELLYVGTGNASPYPIWLRSPSGGDNLYLASILALDPDDGRLVWHYQTTPGEIWDYTATQNMCLAELEIGGRLRKVIMQAPKNGFFYVLDRETGEFLSAEPFVFVSWASHIDAGGRPVKSARAVYRHAPAIVFPAESGAHNWQPMAWSPQTGLAYIPAREQGMLIVNEPFYRWTPGELNMGAKAIFGAVLELLPAPERASIDALLRARPELPPLATREFLIAYDPVAQAERWRVPVGNEQYAGGGVLATAANLVVQGTSSGRLVVRRADTGHELASLEVGTAIMAAPISYEIEGVQYIAVIAGLGGAVASRYPRESAAWTYENYGRLLAFELGGGPTPLPKPRSPGVTPEPPTLASDSDAAAAERGAKLFGSQCAHCHGGRGEERLSAYPDLFRLSAETHASFDAIVRGGALASAGMASFADVVSEADVTAIQSFLVREQRVLRAKEQSAR
ncbi:MAG: PQQ-dependent dehydrogenase, methanol/ethanol family [Myxococcota bacterium]